MAPIKNVFILDRQDVSSYNSGYQVYVGDLPTPGEGTLCNETPIDIRGGIEVSCNLPGQFVTILRPGE